MALVVLKYLNQQFSGVLCAPVVKSAWPHVLFSRFCVQSLDQAGAERSSTDSSGLHHMLCPKAGRRDGRGGEQSKQSSKARERGGGRKPALPAPLCLCPGHRQAQARAPLSDHLLGKTGEAGELKGIQETQRPEAFPRSLGAWTQLSLREL